MLNISFFIATFSSIFWLIYSLRFVNFQMLSTLNSEVLFQSVIIILLPIAVIWGVFSVIKSHLTEQKVFHCLYNSLNQIKKSTDSATEIGQNLINTQKDLKGNLLFQQFDFLISDINEILSDIIKRSNSVSSAQLEHLWTRTTGGERWIMAKTVIEIVDYQPDFSIHLSKKAQKDPVLKGNILEFCARYNTIINLLKTNNNQLFSNIIETGALGKVYEIIKSIAGKLNTPSAATSSVEKTPLKEEISQPTYFNQTEELLEFPSFLSKREDSTPTISSPHINSYPQETNDIDTGLRAIREEILSSKENEDTHTKPSEPVITGFTQTQIALRDIKNTSSEKESKSERKIPIISLEELEKEINSSPENNYDEYAYPFGAWLDGKKNK